MAHPLSVLLGDDASEEIGRVSDLIFNMPEAEFDSVMGADLLSIPGMLLRTLLRSQSPPLVVHGLTETDKAAYVFHEKKVVRKTPQALCKEILRVMVKALHDRLMLCDPLSSVATKLAGCLDAAGEVNLRQAVDLFSSQYTPLEEGRKRRRRERSGVVDMVDALRNDPRRAELREELRAGVQGSGRKGLLKPGDVRSA